jgi:type IV pilus assembly protein PilC
MEKYTYKGINQQTNKISRGQMNVNNPNELETSLTDMGILLISYKIEQKSFLDISLFSPLTHKDLITFFSHLEQLDNAGVSIIDALYDIKNSSSYPQKIKTLVQEIYESVKNGNLFSESVEKHPKVFDKVFVGLIANGEKTGHLNLAFRSIIEHLKWSDAIKKKTIKAIRYPLFSMLVMLLVMMVMTNFVVPKVTVFLQEQKLDLPGITIALIAFSDFMQSYSFAMLVSIPVTIVIYKSLRRIPEFALAADDLKLHIPIFGAIIRKLDASRFCNFFSITFESGTGVLDCLESTKQVIGNMAIKDSIDTIKQKVSDGQSLAGSIDASGHFTGLVVRMFKVGEDSGNMTEALKNIKFFYDQEINDSIDSIVGMIQPTLVFVMGGMMLWITSAIFGPIYDSFSTL